MADRIGVRRNALYTPTPASQAFFLFWKDVVFVKSGARREARVYIYNNLCVSAHVCSFTLKFFRTGLRIKDLELKKGMKVSLKVEINFSKSIIALYRYNRECSFFGMLIDRQSVFPLSQ